MGQISWVKIKSPTRLKILGDSWESQWVEYLVGNPRRLKGVKNPKQSKGVESFNG